MTMKSIGVRDLCKVMLGEEPCLWKIWYEIRHKDEKPTETSPALIRWKMEHTSMLNKLSNDLRTKGGRLLAEEWVKLDVEGGRIIGRVDLINETDIITIYDCKVGKERESDHLQMWLYLYMLINDPRYRGNELRGVLKYKGKDVEYDTSDIPENLPGYVEEYTRILLDDGQEPSKSPGNSCRFCWIECDERVTTDEWEF